MMNVIDRFERGIMVADKRIRLDFTTNGQRKFAVCFTPGDEKMPLHTLNAYEGQAFLFAHMSHKREMIAKDFVEWIKDL